MSEQLYRRVVRTDGHEGNWFDFEPVSMSCDGCVHKIICFEPMCETCSRNWPDLYEEESE